MLSEKQIKDNRLLKEDVLPHHRRMLEWAKKQPPDEDVNRRKMESEIYEIWRGEYCAFCREYWSILNRENCFGCPLYEKYGNCHGDNYPKNKWAGIDDASTWGEWVKAETEFIEQLESLEVKE